MAFASAAPLGDRRVFLGIAVLCAVGCWALHGVRHDDAYITYRYAENLSRGVGPVFNPSQRILGTTAPGHMLLGALIYSFTGKAAFASAMAMLGCIGWAAQALAAFALLRASFGFMPSAFACAAVAVGAASSAEFVALETNVVAACVLWSMAFAQRGRWMAAALSVAAAGLVRPDAYLAAILIGAWGLYEARGALRGPIAAFLALALPWQLFAFAYYGSPLPLPASTKYGKVSFAEYAAHALSEPIDTLIPWSPNIGVRALAWLLVALGAYVWIRRTQRAFIVPAYALAHFAAYATLRPFTQHTWHLYPLRIGFALLIAAALAAGYERLERSHVPSAARIACAFAASVLLGLYAQRTTNIARTHDTAYWLGARHATYLEVSRFIRRHARPGEVIGSVEVGTIGYYTELPMIDFGGLISNLRGEGQPIGRVRWIVVDPEHEVYAGAMLPVRKIERHGFSAYVYNVDWMHTALLAVAARFPSSTPQELLTERRAELAAELAAMLSARDQPL